MANLYEEKDSTVKPVEASEELNLGQRAFKKYSENFDSFNQDGFTPERMFNALYERESKNLGGKIAAPEQWAKETAMDRFLSDATSYTQKTLQSRQDEKTRANNLQNMGDVERGLRGYTHSTAGLAAAFGALGAKKLLPGKWGDDIALSLYDTYKEQERKASLYPTKSIISEKEGEWFDFSQIQGPGDVADFIQGVAGETVPTMAYIAASSLTGAGIGAVTAGPVGAGIGAISGLFNGVVQKVGKKFVAKQVEHLLAKNVAKEAAEVIAKKAAARMAGGAVGMTLGSFSLEAGSGFTNAVEHFSKKYEEQGMDPGDARLHAMEEANGLLITTMATAGSLVEHLGGSSRLLKKVLGPGASEAAEEVMRIARATRANPEVLGRVLNVGKGLLLEAAKQAPAEFGQEALQEILGMANIEFTDPDFQIMSQENLKGYLDAGIAGAVGGVATGMATRVTGAAREAMGVDEKPNVAAEIELLKRKIQNQEEILAKDPASFPGIQARLEQNRRDLEALSGYAKVEAEGLSYADAAARINEESPSPDGKVFGVRQLKNMLRDGRIKKLDEGTVDRTSLETFLEGRKARAEGVDPATATQRTMAAEAAGQARQEAAAAAAGAQTPLVGVEPASSAPGKLGGKAAPKAEAAKSTVDMIDEEKALAQLDADQEAQRLAFEQEQERLATGADETPVAFDEEPSVETKVPGSLEEPEGFLDDLPPVDDDGGSKSAGVDFSETKPSLASFNQHIETEKAAGKPAKETASLLKYVLDGELYDLDQTAKRIGKEGLAEDHPDRLSYVAALKDAQEAKARLDEFMKQEGVTLVDRQSSVSSSKVAPLDQKSSGREAIQSKVLSRDYTSVSDAEIKREIARYKKVIPQTQGWDQGLARLMTAEQAHLESVLEKRSVERRAQDEAAAEATGVRPGRFAQTSAEIDEPNFGYAPKDEPFAFESEDPDVRADNLREAEDYFQMAEDFLPPEVAANAKKLRVTVEEMFGKDGYEKLAGAGLMRMFYEIGNPAGDQDEATGGFVPGGRYLHQDRTAEFNIGVLETRQQITGILFHEIGVHHGIESFIDKVGGEGAFDRFRKSFIDVLGIKDGEFSTEFKKGGLFFGIQQSKKEVLKSHNDFMLVYNRVLSTYVNRKGGSLSHLKGKSMDELMRNDRFFHEFLGHIASMTNWTNKNLPAWLQNLLSYLKAFFKHVGVDYVPTIKDVQQIIYGSMQNILATDNVGIKAGRLSAAHAAERSTDSDAAYVKFPVAEEVREWQTIDAAPKDAVKLEFVQQRSPKMGAHEGTFGLPYLQQDGKTPVPVPGLKQQIRFFLNFAVSRGDLNFVVQDLPAEITPELFQEVLAERPARANVFFSPEILGREAKPAPVAQRKSSAMEQAELLASQEAEQNAGPKTKPGGFGTKPKVEAPKALNISSYEDGLGKKLSNFAPIPIVFNGKKYARSEDAYQKAKKTLPDLSDKSVQDLMVQILVAKLEQHPELLKELQGGKGFEGGWGVLRNASHDLIKNGKTVKSDRWTGKDGLFMRALRGAYNELWKRSEEAQASKVEVPKVEVPKVEVPKVEVPKVEVPKVASSAPLIPMTYMHDPQKGLALRDDVLEAGAEGAFDAVAIGKRTGTTRVFKDYLKQFADQLADKPQLSAGDIDKMTGQQMADYLNEHLAGQQIRMAQDQKIIMAEVTEFVDAASLTPEQWSEIEGWDQIGYHRAVVGKKAPTVQMRFKVLETRRVEFKKQPVSKAVQPAADTAKFDKEEREFKHDIPPLGKHSRSDLPSPVEAFRGYLVSLGASPELASRVVPKMDEIQTQAMHDEFADLVFGPLAVDPVENSGISEFLESDEFKDKVKGLRGAERFSATLKAIVDFFRPDPEKMKKQNEKIADAVVKIISKTEERGSLAPVLQMFFEPPARETKQKKPLTERQIEKQKKEVVEKIRALPQRKRMRLLSLVDKTAHKAALSAGSAGIARHARRLTALTKNEGIYEPALTGELEGFLNSVADYMQMVGSQRGNDKHRIEQIKNAFNSASDVVSAIAKKDSPTYVRMLETFGTDFKSYAGALWAAKRELSELHDNLIADRRLLRKDRLISWVKGITLPEFDPKQHRHLVTVSDPNLRRLASAQAYIDENIAAVRRAMDTHSVYGYLSADAKDLFAKMIGGFSTARAYSGRASEARRERFSGMVANLSTLDLAGHLSGAISPQDAAILVEALSEDQKTEQAIIDELMKQYRLAEQMKSDSMLTSAVTGPGHVKSTAEAMKMVASARSVTGFSSLADFRAGVVTALEGTLGRLVASGAITEADAAEMRTSWSGRASKKNSADLRNYEQGTDTENSQFHRHISQTLNSLSEKLGANITVATSLFPAVSSGEVQRLESIAGALKAEARPGSAMAQLHPEEIFLGLVGFGLRNSERGMNLPAYSGIPVARLKLLADAGFMSSEGKAFYPISGEFKAREIKAFQKFSLFQQMELSVNSRSGSFFSEGEVSDFVPADGRFVGLRRFGPGSMLYDRKTKEFLFVGGRNQGSVGGKTVSGYSLLRTQMNGDRVTLDYVREGDPKRGPVKLHSFEDIAAQNLTVVPNLWGLMPGATSFSNGEFGMFQDYDILNGQKAIRRKTEVNGVLERNRKARLSRPVHAEIVRDAAGQNRLVTYDGDGNEKVLAIRDASSNLREDRAVQLALSHVRSTLSGNKEVRELLAQARELTATSSPDRVAWIHGRLLNTLEYELQRTGVADAVSPDVLNRIMMMAETTLDVVIEEATGVQEEANVQSEFDGTEVIDQSVDEADAMEQGDKDPTSTQGKQTVDQLMESAEDVLVEDMLFAEDGSDLAIQRDLAVEGVMNALLPADTFKSAWRGVLAQLPHSVKGRLNDKLKAAKIASDMSINDLLYDGHPEIALHLLSALSQYAPKALGLSRAAVRVAYGVKGIEIAVDHIVRKIPGYENNVPYSEMLPLPKEQGAMRALLSLTGVLHHYLAAYQKFARKKIRSAAKNPWADLNISGDALAKAIEAAGLRADPGTIRRAWNLSITGRVNEKVQTQAMHEDFAELALGPLPANPEKIEPNGNLLYGLATADIPFDLIHAASGADTQSLKEQWTRGIYEDRSRESSGFVNQQSLYPGEFQETLQGHLVQAIIEKFGAIPGPMGEIAAKLDENPTLANAIDLLSEVVDDVDDELMAIARAYLSGEDGSFDEKNAGAETVDDLSYFVGVDNIGYNIITEQEAAANREEYPPLRSQSISGMELRLIYLIEEMSPGSYRMGRLNKARDGRSATIKINDEEVAVEFGETVYVGEFGAALLQQARSIIEHAHVPGAMNQEARQRLLAAVAEFSGYENMYGPGSTARLLNARTRAGKTMHKLDVRKMPAWDKILVKARELLSEITVFGKVPPRVILHAPNETGWGFVSNFETRGLLSAADAQFLKLAPEHIAREHFQRVMGLVDRNGVIHVFLGQHATKDGKFDWDEFYRTVYHEGIGHLGLRKALGEGYEDFLVGVFNSHLKTDRNAHLSRESRISHAEEWMAGKAEQVRMDAAAGRPINKHIGTLLDRVATMVIKAFRKIMDKLGFKDELAATGFEVRDALARAFNGSHVGGRTGFSSLLPPGMVTGENLVRYESFGSEYQANTADTLMRKFTDYLRPWEMLSRSLLNFGIDIKASENFMYGLRTQKSRIGDLVKNTKKYRQDFVRILKDAPFGVEEVSNLAHALHALERNSGGVGAELARRTAVAEARLQAKIDAGEFTNIDGTLDEKAIAAERKKLEGRKAVRDNAIRRLVKEGNFNQISGMTTNDANALIAEMLAKGYVKEDGKGGYTGRMMDAVNKLVETNALALDMMAASGLITGQARDSIREMYRYYVPIPGKPEPTLGRQFIDMQAGNRFKQAQGVSMVYDQGQIEDQRTVAGVTFSGLNARIAEIGMNETNQTILEFTKNHSNPELFQAFLPDAEFDELKLHLEALRAVKVDGGQVSDTAMNERGFFRMPTTAGMDRRTLKEFEAENGYLPVYVGGQMHYLRVLNKDLRAGLDQLNSPVEAGRVMRMLGHVTRYLVKINTSMNPEFFMSNMVRDIGSAFNTLSIRQNISGLDGRDFAKKVVAKAIPAMAVIKARNFGGKRESLSAAQQKLWDLYEEFEASGGKIQWAFLETAEETMSSLTEAVRVMQGKGSVKEKTRAFYDKVEDLFQRSADIFENSTRFAIFATAIEAGASRQDAALMARETTVDFDRKGEMGQALNTLYMFANAGIQGSLTILRTMLRNPGRAARHIGAIVGFSLSLALLNAFAGGSGDDDEPLFFGISEETRNTHMVFMLPGLDQGLKIPLPWGYAFFWSIGQQFASMAMGRASATTVGANLIGAGLNNFNPLESAASLSNSHGWVRMLAPTVVDPLVDIGFEKTPFGTPLMPQKVYEDQPDSARHWRSVSGPSKAVADFINNDLGGGSAGVPGWVSVSPETLDLLFEQATGGLGRLVTRSIGSAMSPVSGKELTMNDIPVARRFFAGVGAWEDRNRFRSIYDEIHGVNRTMKNLQDNARLAQDPELKKVAMKDVQAFREENQHVLAMRVPVNKVYSRVKAIDEQKKALYKSGLPESEVNPKLRALDERQREIFTTFNRMYYEKIDR